MEKIKFRAWDESRKKIFNSNMNKWVELRMSDDGEVKAFNYKFGGEAQELKLMPYTGLKDKNGVEIYEGDIVEDHNGTGFVEYVEKYAAHRVNYKNGSAKWFYDYILNGERCPIEVIGNIYENPELIPL